VSDSFDRESPVEMEPFRVQQKVLFAVEEKIPARRKKNMAALQDGFHVSMLIYLMLTF
jgi:hypothetical protein